MSKGANHNYSAGRHPERSEAESKDPAALSNSYITGFLDCARNDVEENNPVRHIYVHIPFCARICPYCAFYKDLLDRSQTSRFCEALLRELELNESRRRTGDRRSLLRPSTIYFGGGTPTALNIAQLELLLRGFHERLELSQLVEWTIEANPGSVSARKAALLKKFGVNRISLGVQSWDDELLKVLGREHNAQQAEESFRILRDADFTNVNVDLMFGLPGQTVDQWRASLETTIALQPEHISAYCLTYEEDTEFFLRHARGEFRQDPDADAEFFEITMAMLEEAGYEHYEISNYARPGFRSVHNRAYIDRVLSGESTLTTSEHLTHEMKRTERIALGLRTRDGISASELKDFAQETDELIGLQLLRKSNGNFLLTRRGKSLADSITEAFL